MYKFIIKRLLMLIPVLLGISFILYSIMSLTPGDAATLMLGDSANEQAILKLREELGLNGGFFENYIRYIGNIILHGDFGISYRTRNPVFTEVLTRFHYTLRLAFTAILISTVFGVLFGIIAAVKQYSFTDNFITAVTLALTSMPDFWLGMMLIIIFAVTLKLLPISGATSWRHFILPGLTASANYMAYTIRQTRSSMLETIRMDYVRTARAKGVPEGKIVFGHTLKNALMPIVTLVGVNMGWQLGGTIIIEQIFGIPGLGSLLIMSIRLKDTPVIIASVMFVATLSSLINLGTDILYAFIDPRIKSLYQTKKKAVKTSG